MKYMNQNKPKLNVYKTKLVFKPTLHHKKIGLKNSIKKKYIYIMKHF